MMVAIRKPAQPEKMPERSVDVARTNAALKAGGIDYQVGRDGKVDYDAFTTAAMTRWSKVTAKLAE